MTKKNKVRKVINELTDFRLACQGLFKTHSNLISSIIDFHSKLANKQNPTDEDVQILTDFNAIIEALKESVESLSKYNQSMDKEYIPAMKILYEIAKDGKNEE
ncbi:hypothetical protein [Citrobacter werkmanii]|uniref:hypothetical protein n=1 Tax=Citrobacter werkmanii TaxID=67827 RepID=UPI003F8D84F9